MQKKSFFRSLCTLVHKLAPLQKINDNYEKIILSLNPGMDSSYEGIKPISGVSYLSFMLVCLPLILVFVVFILLCTAAIVTFLCRRM